MMRPLYIGIDDTDNLATRGTGYRARQLMQRLQDNQLAEGVGITRHQLLFDDRVPYTSHNSSACLAVRSGKAAAALTEFCRKFLLQIAADGSDVGLCVSEEKPALGVEGFGQRAKVDLVSQAQARAAADRQGIFLQGLTGDHQGIIGALSAVGLHVGGNDGRYIWGRGLRDHDGQTLTLAELKTKTSIGRVTQLDGVELEDQQVLIDLGPWPRALRLKRQAVLLVEQVRGGKYRVLDKDVIKSLYP